MPSINRCLNPFKTRHTVRKTSFLRPLSEEQLQRYSAQFPHVEWTVGDKLCLKCRLEVKARLQDLSSTHLEASDDEENPTGIADLKTEEELVEEGNVEPDGLYVPPAVNSTS